MPDIIVPGFPKSGTSSLFDCMVQHTKIFGQKKEPHIYSIPDRYFRRFDPSYDRSFINIFREKPKDSLCIEASTTYLISKQALELAYYDNPGLKIIILARDPIERIISHYNWLRKLGIAKKIFREEIKDWLGKDFDPNMHFRGNYKYYVNFSLYGEQLKRCFSIFCKDQILLVSAEEFKSDPHSVISRIFKFLSIHDIKINTIYSNVTGREFVVKKYPKMPRPLSAVLPSSVKGFFKPFFEEKYQYYKPSKDEMKWLFSLLEADFLMLKNEINFIPEQWHLTREIASLC